MTPAVDHNWIIGPAITAMLARNAEHEKRQAADAQFRCAHALADSLALVLRRSSGEVFDALTHVPDNMLPLLCSPEGWSALAQFVAADLGSPSLNFKPTVH